LIERRRGVFNVIVPDRLYQRGQILTWTLESKRRAFSDVGITAYVNLWPKLDPDLALLDLDWYFQIPCPRSEQVLEARVISAARSVANYLSDDLTRRALVLCEAGRTRSVFFCILVKQCLHKQTMLESRANVLRAVPGHALKRFHEEWLQKQ
jgi:hypothetical protein